MLLKFAILACKYVVTTLDRNEKLRNDSSPTCDQLQFRQIVGSGIYLTITQPDLSYLVGLLSQFMQKPTTEHMYCVHRIQRYVSGTIDRGLLYMKGALQLLGYTDATT